MELAEVFVCRRCGRCCQGEGGIYLRPGEAARAAAAIGLSPAVFSKRFTVADGGGLLSLPSAEDGYCVLYDRLLGNCRIHAAKPAMCRAWPFFSGPLRYAEGFAAIKAFCPGIHPDAEWADFTAFHRAYVQETPPESFRRALSQSASPPLSGLDPSEGNPYEPRP